MTELDMLAQSDSSETQRRRHTPIAAARSTAPPTHLPAGDADLHFGDRSAGNRRGERLSRLRHSAAALSNRHAMSLFGRRQLLCHHGRRRDDLARTVNKSATTPSFNGKTPLRKQRSASSRRLVADADRCILIAFARVRLVQRLLFDMLQKRETTINVRTAIEMLTGSWNDIQRSTVTGSFRKSGFDLQEEDEEEDVADEDLQCAVEPESWPLIQRRFGESGTFLNFVEADNNLAVAEDLSDESIIRMVQEGEQEEDTDTDVSDSEDSTPPMTSGEVMTVLGKVRKHIQLWPSGHEALDLNEVDPTLKEILTFTCFEAGQQKS
ncbi:hypothetical protein HPB50_002218 [Hyalomma asiaticum]|uniref:Uncharacterized protein n=1 Tax=Hyalomma asiaticum TaxID=266040 RepID=A0ACB7RGY1_HYAAI|nr:hypothetical protein HPB50_002218 [Hyalomma asiaticum]